ncbi:hypothetical protein FQR65_LT15907 [Abscondita terminalis]|nr:hypothetical protein FQR65_LT15907 [Abscondita terminalis]
MTVKSKKEQKHLVSTEKQKYLKDTVTRYEFNNAYLEQYEKAGMIASGFKFEDRNRRLNKNKDCKTRLKRVKEGLPPVADTTKNPAKTAVNTNQVDSAELKKPFGATKYGEEKIITLQNEKIIAKITSKGGRVKSVELKNEKNFDGSPLILFDGNNNRFGLMFNAAGQNISTNNLNFQTTDADVSVSKGDSKTVKFRLSYNDAQYIEYTYTLKGDDYNLGLGCQCGLALTLAFASCGNSSTKTSETADSLADSIQATTDSIADSLNNVADSVKAKGDSIADSVKAAH